MSKDISAPNLHKQYFDSTLSLSGRKLGSLEIGREVGAWVQSLAPKPEDVDWQTRATLEKASALVKAKRRGAVVLFNFDPEQHLLLRFLVVSRKLVAGEFEVCSIKWNQLAAIDALGTCIDDLLASQVAISKDEVSLVRAIRRGDDTLNVIILPPNRPDLQRAVASRFVQGCSGVMFVRDFSIAKTAWPFEYLRQNNLTMVETADGFGECWSL